MAEYDAVLSELDGHVAAITLDRPEPPCATMPRVFVPGEEYRRDAIHGLFGGQRQRGIVTPARAQAIFLFSSPGGAAAGYADGWTAERQYYLYTGEGQSGDMRLTAGNRAILEHRERGRPLLLFEYSRPGWYRYVGEFEYVSHERREGIPDREGHPRTAIVFRLRPRT